MDQPDITDFLDDRDEGMSMVGQFIFGAAFFAIGLGSGWLIWG